MDTQEKSKAQKVMETIKLDSIESAIEDIKKGKVIIVVDDEDRENEGDFICAAEAITPEIVNFMATHGRGLICAPIEEKRAEELDLNMMVNSNTALHETAFTVSIDYKRLGVTTGISAYDRSTGIKALTESGTKGTDYARPGHIFPLRAKTGGVLRRTGHTEAAIDFARLAGYYPAGVLVEILNEDGSMARLPQLVEIAKKHDLKLVAIKDLVAYRMRTERIVKREYECEIDSKYGKLTVIAYNQLTTDDTHLAIIKGKINNNEGTLVRVHSESETGDVLSELFSDGGVKMRMAMEKIDHEGSGVLIYMRQGEKGANLVNKLKNIVNDDVSIESGEQRDFGVGAQIIRDLGISKLRLITNHPRKRIGLIGYGLEVVENIEL